MSAATTLGLVWTDAEPELPARVDVVDGADLRARYDSLVEQLLRLGGWLQSPQAQILPAAVWEEWYAEYQEQLERLRELGEALRPFFERRREERLVGDALVSEVLELFAA